MGREIRNIPCRYRARARLIGNILWPILAAYFWRQEKVLPADRAQVNKAANTCCQPFLRPT